MERVAQVATRFGDRHLAGECQHGLVALIEDAAVDAVRKGVDLLIGDAGLPRRGSVTDVSVEAAVSLRQLQTQQLLNTNVDAPLVEDLLVEAVEVPVE